MKILHLSMLYPPYVIGGAEKSVALLCEAQRAAGYEVAASCTTPGAGLRETVNGVPVYRLPHGTDFWAEEWPRHGALARLKRKLLIPFSLDFEAAFGEALDDFKPDIVHTHSMTDVSTRAWLAAAARRLPIVHTLRDYDLLCSNSSLFHAGRVCEQRHLKCRVLTAAKREHHRHVSAVVGVGAGILQTHLDHGYFGHVPEALRRFIWNPAVLDGPLDASLKPVTGRPLTFGYIGRINVEKGVGTLLRACRALPQDGWKLIIAGKSPLPDDPLMKMAEGLPVEFIGFVPAADFFSRIDALVVPSVWAEPLPRTILESYAAGVPVLGSRSGGIPDLIGHHNKEWLFTPDSDVELAIHMKRLILDGRSKLPTRSTFESVLSETTPTKVVERYADLYGAVLASVSAA